MSDHTGSKALATTVVLIDRAIGLIALFFVAATGAMFAAREGLTLPGSGYVWLPPLLALAALVIPVSLAAQMLPVSINGFGVREAVFAFFFARLHLDLNPALTLSLGSTGLIKLFSLSGGALFLLRHHRS